MDLAKLGQLVQGVAGRDAVHVAIVPIEAAVDLEPGWHVGIRDGKATTLKPHIGIVDPFLRGHVTRGERFWLCLYPGTITSLRHEWTHPAFAEEDRPPICTKAELLESERWLAEFSSNYCISLDQMIQAAKLSITGQQFALCFGDEDGQQRMEYDGAKWELFDHLENVLGQRIPQAVRENASFRCAC